MLMWRNWHTRTPKERVLRDRGSTPLMSTKKRASFMNNDNGDSISLREYFDAKILSQEKAIALAYQSMEKRLEGMNEFRDTLRDQASRFVTRVELDAQIEKIEANLRPLELSKANLEGKASQTAFYIAIFFSVAGLILGIINLIDMLT